jgi:hypothetical protein
MKQWLAVFLRHPGDEAASLAGAVNILSWILGKATESFNKSFGRFSDSVGEVFTSFIIGPIAVVVLIVVLTIGAKLVLNLIGFSDSYSDIPGEVIVVAALVVLSLWAIVAISIHATRLVISAILAIFFGSEMLFLGSSVRLTAETTPPGRWQVVTLPDLSHDNRLSYTDSQVYSYAHGRVYEDPVFLAYISDWIATRVGIRTALGPAAFAARN